MGLNARVVEISIFARLPRGISHTKLKTASSGSAATDTVGAAASMPTDAAARRRAIEDSGEGRAADASPPLGVGVASKPVNPKPCRTGMSCHGDTGCAASSTKYRGTSGLPASSTGSFFVTCKVAQRKHGAVVRPVRTGSPRALESPQTQPQTHDGYSRLSGQAADTIPVIHDAQKPVCFRTSLEVFILVDAAAVTDTALCSWLNPAKYWARFACTGQVTHNCSSHIRSSLHRCHSGPPQGRKPG